MHTESPSWVSNAVFYQIFPDRFARREGVTDGLTFEPWDSPPTVHGFKGGDLYGIADRLDYLGDLGVTALYLNPVFASASNHRYHTYDYFQVDPFLGGNDALRFLIDEAHRLDIRVILDGVFNHASRGFWPFHHVMECGAASPYRDWFHFDTSRLEGRSPFLPYPSSQAERELRQGTGSLEAVGYAAWWNLPALPKFNVRSPAVRAFLFSVAEHWISFGIDGWRLDVPNEIDDDSFWREFRSRVRAINPEAYIVGEVWGEAQRWLKGDMWDGVMNYQLTAACMGFFGGPDLDLEHARRPSSFRRVRPLSAEEFATELDRLDELYPDAILRSQLNLLDSHDMPRFLTCVRERESALRMAWLFVCSVPGAPCLYYGDELGMVGGHDPDCRRSFPADAESRNPELRHWFRDCIALRRHHAALRHGRRTVLHAGGRILALLFRSEGDAVVAVWNTSDEPSTVTVELPDAATTAGPWTTRLGEPAAVDISDDGRISLQLPAQTAVVLAADQ